MENPLIAHILPFDGVAGTEIATLRLAMAARECGYGSLAFCLSDRTRSLFSSNGFPTVMYEKIEPSYRHLTKYWHDSFHLARQFRGRGVSLVHCADVLAGFHVSLAALLARKRLVCHVRNRICTMTLRERSVLMPVDKFVFVSKSTWQTFAFPVPASKGMVLYDGIEPGHAISDAQRGTLSEELRHELGIPLTRRIVGMVGRISGQKDYATLARAAAFVLARHDVCFVLVGDYAAESHRAVFEETRRLLSSLHIEDRFIFTGFRTDVSELMSTFDIFVLSTHFEGFPLVILEAMADARPVAATAVDGIPEIVEHEATGLLHAHEDFRQLAANLNRLLEDPSLARRLGVAGRDLVATEFSNRVYAKSVSGFYRSVI